MFQMVSSDFLNSVPYISLTPFLATSTIQAVSSAATYCTIYLTLRFAQGRRILYPFLYTDSSRHTCIKPASSDEEEQAHIGSKFQSLTFHISLLFSCDCVVTKLHSYCVESEHSNPLHLCLQACVLTHIKFPSLFCFFLSGSCT